MYRYILFALCVCLAAACKKDAEYYVIRDGVFATGALKASGTNLVLTKAAENDTAVKFNWSAADFGGQPVIAYTLQLTLPGDTTAANNWGSAKTYITGANAATYGFLTKELNDLLNMMSFSPGNAGKIAVRIKADVPQANGSASTVTPVYSNTLVLDVTTYATVLYIPGDYQGWNPGAAPVLNPVAGKPGMYEGYVYMEGTGTLYFKFTNAPDWVHTNYGDGGNGSFSTDGNAAGLSVNGGGYYYLTADLNTNTWTATKTTWSILGDATPGGWNTDTQLSYDKNTQSWTVTAVMKTAGSFKFRANNDWKIDFGIDANGKLTYADNPFLGYTPDLNNLSVPSDGTYKIVLDLHESGKYTYSLTKQ